MSQLLVDGLWYLASALVSVMLSLLIIGAIAFFLLSERAPSSPTAAPSTDQDTAESKDADDADGHQKQQRHQHNHHHHHHHHHRAPAGAHGFSASVTNATEKTNSIDWFELLLSWLVGLQVRRSNGPELTDDALSESIADLFAVILSRSVASQGTIDSLVLTDVSVPWALPDASSSANVTQLVPTVSGPLQSKFRVAHAMNGADNDDAVIAESEFVFEMNFDARCAIELNGDFLPFGAVQTSPPSSSSSSSSAAVPRTLLSIGFALRLTRIGLKGNVRLLLRTHRSGAIRLSFCFAELPLIPFEYSALVGDPSQVQVSASAPAVKQAMLSAIAFSLQSKAVFPKQVEMEVLS